MGLILLLGAYDGRKCLYPEYRCPTSDSAVSRVDRNWPVLPRVGRFNSGQLQRCCKHSGLTADSRSRHGVVWALSSHT